MRKIALIVLTALVLVVLNAMILQKERLLDNGRTVFLQLAPRDPRSLMQGDYMVLRYQLANDARREASKLKRSKGKLVISIDEKGVAKFVRIYKDGELAAGEHLLVYRLRKRVRLGAESFFFQEGHARYYNTARYGELKVADDGRSVLVGLRDDKLQPMGPQ